MTRSRRLVGHFVLTTGLLAVVWIAPAAPGQSPDVALVGYLLSDNGDDDGFSDTNETVDMRIRVRNTTMQSLTGIDALLVAEDPGTLCVTDPVISIGSLAPGETRLTAAAFRFRVSPGVERTGTCSIGGGSCASDADCAGGGDVCDAALVDLSAGLKVVFTHDESGGPLDPQRLSLDLDLDVAGGSGPGSFREGFESGGFGSFTTMNLDSGRHSWEGSQGFRCQYANPDWINANNYELRECFLGATTAQADAYFWRVDGPAAADGGRAYLGSYSIHMGVPLGAGLGFTTPLSILEAIGTSEPVHLGWDRVCEADRMLPCHDDTDCPAGQSCEDPASTLTFKHQVSLIDSRSTNTPPGEAVDRVIVQLQLAAGDGSGVGDWIKLYPFRNIYDQQGTDNFADCTFDPTDDGNDEDDFFDPGDPFRRLGPSSTCFPEYAFVHLGDTDDPPLAGGVGNASDGPGLAGSSGDGTWVESEFDLSRWRGRSVRLRFLATTIEVGSYETAEDRFAWNPLPTDDGWWIDDVQVTDTLTQAASLVADTRDNSGFPPLPDDDSDGVSEPCDNCPSLANPDQADQDGDLIGDLCDACPLEFFNDEDGDGICCPEDNCCRDPNPDQQDSDGDGTGDPCDTNPVFLVSSDPNDQPDFENVVDAVDGVTESGTRVRIMPGFGPYASPVLVDKFRLVHFEGVNDGSGDPVVIDGGSGAAFDLRSTYGTARMTLSNLTIRGSTGVRAVVPVVIRDCAFEQNPVTGVDLTGTGHELERVRMESSSTTRGVWVRPLADVSVRRSIFDGLAGRGFRVEGSAEVSNSIVAFCDDGFLLAATGSLDLKHSTVVGNSVLDSYGVDNRNGGDVTITGSILTQGFPDMAGVDCSDVFWSDVQGVDCSAVNGNISAWPGFTVDFALASDSPCLDRGPDPDQFVGAPCLDFHGNPRMRDHDGDGLARMDMGAIERENESFRPFTVANLKFEGAATLRWNVTPGAIGYHVYRGSLADLAYDSYGVCRDDLDPDPMDTQLIDGEVPAPGAGFSYAVTIKRPGLVRHLGVGTCAERSNYDPCP